MRLYEDLAKPGPCFHWLCHVVSTCLFQSVIRRGSTSMFNLVLVQPSTRSFSPRITTCCLVSATRRARTMVQPSLQCRGRFLFTVAFRWKRSRACLTTPFRTSMPLLCRSTSTVFCVPDDRNRQIVCFVESWAAWVTSEIIFSVGIHFTSCSVDLSTNDGKNIGRSGV